MAEAINPVGVSYPVNPGMVQLPPLAPNTYAPPLNKPALAPVIMADGRVMVPTQEPRGEHGVIDFVKDVGVGAVESVTDMAKGLVFLAKGAVNVVTHPIQTVKKVGGVVGFAIKNPAAAGQTLVRIPGAIVHGIVRPYKEAWQNGEYGKVVGRLGVDIAMIYMTSKIGKGSTAVGDGTVGVNPMAVTGDITPGLGTGTGSVQQVIKQGTNVAKNIKVAPIKIGDVAAGATVNINIGAQQVAGSTLNAAGATGATGLGATGLAADVMGTMGALSTGSITPQVALEALQTAKNLGVLGHTAEVAQAARTISAMGLAVNAKDVVAAARVLRNAGKMADYLSVAQALHMARMSSMGILPGMTTMGYMSRMGAPVMGTVLTPMGTMVRPMVTMPAVGMGIMDDVALGAGGLATGVLPSGAYIAADGTIRMAGGFERFLGGMGRVADVTGTVIGKTGQVAGKIVSGTLNGAGKVLSGIVHPIQTIRNGAAWLTNPATWANLHQDLIVGANKAAVGLARGADVTGRALIYAAEHPAQAAAVAGLVGKGGQVTSDGLKHLDLIR